MKKKNSLEKFQNFPHISYAYQFFCSETEEDEEDSDSLTDWENSNDTSSIYSSPAESDDDMEDEQPNVNVLLPLVSRYALTFN